MKTFKSTCGCEIHVIKWSSKANSVTVQMCPVHKFATYLLDSLKILYEETADYIRINNLGDIHHNRSMQYARDMIAKAEGRDTDESRSPGGSSCPKS